MILRLRKTKMTTWEKLYKIIFELRGAILRYYLRIALCITLMLLGGSQGINNLRHLTSQRQYKN